MHCINITSKSDSIGVTCTRLWHFADTFSQWNSCWKKLTLGHMTEIKCGYQMHIFVTSFSAQHAPAWRVLLHGAATSSAISPQMHQQNPADAPPESRGTTRIRRTPTESCLHLQRDTWVRKWLEVRSPLVGQSSSGGNQPFQLWQSVERTCIWPHLEMFSDTLPAYQCKLFM